MLKLTKRFVSVLLLVCTLFSFVVPATFADAGAAREGVNKLNRAEFILKGLQTWMMPVIAVVDLAAIAFIFRKKLSKGKKKEEVEN